MNQSINQLNLQNGLNQCDRNEFSATPSIKNGDALRVNQINCVEVASQELGFIGSYCAATIICSTGDDYYRIKYKTLLTDDESEPLEDVFSATELRPVPPHQHEKIPENGFRLYDMVDVFDNDGWWFGFISARVGDEYYVYFPTTADNIAYPPHLLRIHQEWSNGKWIFLP